MLPGQPSYTDLLQPTQLEPGRLYHGYSLSFCISDILAGLIEESQVASITSGVRAVSPADWQTVLENCQRVHWKRNPDGGMAIALRLIAAGKIDQPKLRGEQPINLSRGWWYPAEAV